MLLWDILVRSQLGFAVAFLEEIWSRNLGHLMMSPLRPSELVAALIAVSLIKLMVAMVPVALLAYLFFGFNVLSLGFAFAAFFANLVIMSWSLGLISTGVVLRWGLGAESFAWLIVFVFLPLCCVYYPVATLPGWLQPVALALPPTYVFEGLRAIVLDGTFLGDLHARGAGAQRRLLCPRLRGVRLLPAQRAGATARWCRWASERKSESRMTASRLRLALYIIRRLRWSAGWRRWRCCPRRASACSRAATQRSARPWSAGRSR